MSRLAFTGFGLLAVMLIGLLWLELHEGAAAPIVVASARAAPLPVMVRAPTRPKIPTDTLVTRILARPLFSINRRPPPSTDVATPTNSVSELPRVAGVVVAPSARSVIFASKSGDKGEKPMVMAEGSHVAGFVVQSIAPGQVTLVGPNGQRVLHPTFDPTALRVTPDPLRSPQNGTRNGSAKARSWIPRLGELQTRSNQPVPGG